MSEFQLHGSFDAAEVFLRLPYFNTASDLCSSAFDESGCSLLQVEVDDAVSHTMNHRAGKARSNRQLEGLMQRLRERTPLGSLTSQRGAGFGTSSTNVGNQLEYLAWLALEDGKPELILALAWHASA